MLNTQAIFRIFIFGILCLTLSVLSSCMGRQGPRKPRNLESYNAFDENDNNNENEPANLFIPKEVSHCQWFHKNSNFPHTSSHLEGGYSVCQSSFDKKKIFFQLQEPSLEEDLCLIPVHRQNNGDLLYIGDAFCQRISSHLIIYKFHISANRENFENFLVTGVLIMRDSEYSYSFPYRESKTSSEAYEECLTQQTTNGNGSYCRAFKEAGQFVSYEFIPIKIFPEFSDNP